MPTKVLVAMSGGVDSSVACLMLAEGGHAVTGVTLRLHDSCAGRARACCGMEDAADARAVARKIGVEHRILEHQAAFERLVVAPFVEAYARGETPNPCILCNERVKFGTLWEYAEREGFDAVATGHHARLEAWPDGHAVLRRGADLRKDQSYVLFTLTREGRDRTLLPVGSLTKAEVRARARAAGLPTAEKAESQDICFVDGDGYAAFVETRLRVRRAGVIRHVDGRVLARHDGIHQFTVGQRRGLGIPHGEPLYVVSLDPGSGEVVVGPRGALAVRRFRVRGWLWHAPQGARPGAE